MGMGLYERGGGDFEVVEGGDQTRYRGGGGLGVPDKNRAAGARFSLAICGGGGFEIGMGLYGRGEVVLRRWKAGIEWGTSGRGVGGNPTKTEPPGLGFRWRFVGMVVSRLEWGCMGGGR